MSAIRMWAAEGWNGKIRPWTVRLTRKDAMQAATETMMGAPECQALPNLSARWKHCYANGCRMVRVSVWRETK